jgi:hypothetical protein
VEKYSGLPRVSVRLSVKVGDLVRKKLDDAEKIGLIEEIDYSLNITPLVRVRWNKEYGIFWTVPNMLEFLTGDSKGEEICIEWEIECSIKEQKRK